MQVVVGILKRCEARLLEMRDMEKMVAFLRMEVPQWRHDTLQVSVKYQATSTSVCMAHVRAIAHHIRVNGPKQRMRI